MLNPKTAASTSLIGKPVSSRSISPGTASDARRAALLSMCNSEAHIWRERAQMAAKLWSEFTTELASTRTFAEAMNAYSRHSAQCMQMSTEDARRVFEEFQEITQKLLEQATTET
jgi:alpha-D-ribose 1-methylphosphonate 5-triphosphate synthase subunit PhnH